MASVGYANGCAISVRVQPGASRNRVHEFRNGTLRVSVAAPPRNGQANAALLELLAATLDIAKSRLRILRGHSARNKLVAIDGLTAQEAHQRLNTNANPD